MRGTSRHVCTRAGAVRAVERGRRYEVPTIGGAPHETVEPAAGAAGAVGADAGSPRRSETCRPRRGGRRARRGANVVLDGGRERLHEGGDNGAHGAAAAAAAAADGAPHAAADKPENSQRPPAYDPAGPSLSTSESAQPSVRLYSSAASSSGTNVFSCGNTQPMALTPRTGTRDAGAAVARGGAAESAAA